MSLGLLKDRHPLPDIDNGDLRKQVFVHRSAVGAPAGLLEDDEPALDNERLALLGDAVITLFVTSALESNRPLSRVGDLNNKRSLLVSRDRTASWADAYELPGRLCVHRAQEALIPNNKAAKVQVFQAYVGALFKERGWHGVDDWIVPVIEEALSEIQLFEQMGETPGESSDDKSWNTGDETKKGKAAMTEPILPIACPPKAEGGTTPAAAAAPTPVQATGTAVAPPTASSLGVFNERCSQKLKGMQPRWQVTDTGPRHAPEFTATVTLPGGTNPVGIGIGTSSKLAKQQAASEAMRHLGWT